jgi:hypothetical protein
MPRSGIIISYIWLQRLRCRSLRGWPRGAELNQKGCGISGGKRHPISCPASDKWFGSLTASPASGDDLPTKRPAETAGAATLVMPYHQSFGPAGFNFQILLVPRGLCEGLPRAEEYLACVKRTPFTEQPTPLRLPSAGSNLRLLTTGEKVKTFSQTFSHPSLKPHETHCGRGGSANHPRSFPS